MKWLKMSIIITWSVAGATNGAASSPPPLAGEGQGGGAQDNRSSHPLPTPPPQPGGGADHFTDRLREAKQGRRKKGHRDDSALAGGVVRLPRGADSSGVGGHVDHASEAARRHAAQHDVAHVQWSVEIDGDDLAPEFGRGIEEIHGAIPSGVVDEERN